MTLCDMPQTVAIYDTTTTNVLISNISSDEDRFTLLKVVSENPAIKVEISDMGGFNCA